MTNKKELRGAIRAELLSRLDFDFAAHVYLIHLQKPLKHARHYVGSTIDLARRIQQHASGSANSCALLRATYNAGIFWEVVRVWGFDSFTDAIDFEYALKKTKNVPRHCPCCAEESKKKAREWARKKRGGP